MLIIDPKGIDFNYFISECQDSLKVRTLISYINNENSIFSPGLYD